MKTLLRITAYSLRRKRLAIIAGAVFAVATLPPLVIPRLVGAAVDEALTSGAQSRLLFLAGIIIVASVLRGVLGFAAIYIGELTGLRVAYDMRRDYFKKLQSLSLGFYDTQQTGNLMSRATVDIDAIQHYTTYGLLAGLGSLTVFGTAVAIMMLIDWRLGLVSLAFLPVIIWPTASMSLRMTPLYGRAHDETGKMNAAVQENLAGMRVVKGFGAREYESAKFSDRAVAVAGHFYEAGKVFVSGQSTIALAFAAVTAAILLIGGQEVFAGRMTAGELASFILYIGVLIRPVHLLGWRVQTTARAIAGGRRVFEVLDAESPVKERPSAGKLHRVRGHVRLERVSMSYNSSAEALHEVDFEVQPGQTVAILGGPGSGKSTVVHLLPRFYEASSGRILIDGIDVRDVTLASLRENVGIVHQDVFAFSATIKDNIAYGKDDATLEEVVAVAQVAQLHDFIEGLADGYDTWVGERGITLSGGQRQRLAIARTVLTDPPILIIDDATSSVDVGTESLIQRALSDVTERRTTFVIAHRLSTVRNADLILVLDRGRIVEQGSHEELLERDGYYRRIYDLQLGPQEDNRVLSTGPTGEPSNV